MGSDAEGSRASRDLEEKSGRSWGFWTQAKLEMLASYLSAFATASKGVSERVYLDAFAGEGRGRDRSSGDEFDGSARIALEAGEDAGFTRFRYFEKGAKAAELETQLRADFPGKDIKVYEGDCNEMIPVALRDLADVKWAPTFAFLDPDGMELAWRTLKALADHKRGYRSQSSTKTEYKVEMWILFPSSGLIRTLALDEGKVSQRDFERATRLFGCEEWKPIYERRLAEEFTGEQAREEYVNLMRWRVEQVLGYKAAHAFEVRNSRGPLYHMIFATDNDAGTNIMGSIYKRAAERLPEMREEAKDRALGMPRLDLGDSFLAPGEGYHYEPPWVPPGSTE